MFREKIYQILCTSPTVPLLKEVFGPGRPRTWYWYLTLKCWQTSTPGISFCSSRMLSKRGSFRPLLVRFTAVTPFAFKMGISAWSCSSDLWNNSNRTIAMDHRNMALTCKLVGMLLRMRRVPERVAVLQPELPEGAIREQFGSS